MKKNKKVDQKNSARSASAAQNAARHSRRGLNMYYFGKGKGKTTAVMGLAARAAGAGLNVFILQFVKAKKPAKGAKLQSGEWPVSSEILYFDAAHAAFKPKRRKLWSKIGHINSEQHGAGFVGILGDKKQKKVHVDAAHAALRRASEVIGSDAYDLVVLDELVSAVELGLLSEREVLNLLAKKPKHLHLAYTGHDKFDGIVSASDMVSEITMIKHPYYKGILAQRGIDF